MNISGLREAAVTYIRTLNMRDIGMDVRFYFVAKASLLLGFCGRFNKRET